MIATQAISTSVPQTQPSVNTSLWETVACNLCGSRKVTVKYQGTTDQEAAEMVKSYCASGNFISEETLVTCNDCELVFTSPRLRKDLILKGYTENEDPTYVSQADGRLKSFAACLKKIEKFQKVGSVLDVGAAAGFFLKTAKDKGWATYGIEPSKFLSDYGNRNYGVNIYNGTIEDEPKWNTAMDVVTLWDVLEHTFDPTDVLKRCNRYLKQGGYVVVNYPNIGNWLAKLAGRKWWFIISVHLYYFTPKTIEKMLRQTGFQVVETGPHFQSLQFGYLLYRLEAYLPGPAKFFGKIAKLLKLDGLLLPYYAAQTRVIAKKVESL